MKQYIESNKVKILQDLSVVVNNLQLEFKSNPGKYMGKGDIEPIADIRLILDQSSYKIDVNDKTFDGYFGESIVTQDTISDELLADLIEDLIYQSNVDSNS